MAKGVMSINGQWVSFDGEPNVLSVIRKAGIDMPTLCYYSDLSVYGACRMCVVEDDKGKIDASCSMEPRDGMVIYTNTKRLLKYRRMNIELLLSAHDRDCTLCEKSGDCRLQKLAMRFGVRSLRFQDNREPLPLDSSSPAVVRNPNKCILCGDCVRICEEVQGMNVIDLANRGSELRVMPAFDRKLAETDCISCGQCAAVCTTGAITIHNDIGRVWRALHDGDKRVVFQIAPAVRVAIGEAFGLKNGENAIGRIVAALRLMGADQVYDTVFAADMTTVEETAEFLDRLQNGGKLPMYTSCCPAWVKYVEKKKPELLDSISSCKSPMQMFAALMREYDKSHGDGRELYQVAVMPCTAKKMEAKRPEFFHDGKPDVDAVLTTVELITMIKESGIIFSSLEPDAMDMPFGICTGSGTIFGATGGVAEAVARCCLPDGDKNVLRAIEYSGLRGFDNVKVAELDVHGRTVRLAVCHGLINAQRLIRRIEAGEEYFDLIEVMTCQTGCVGGAGQPHALLPQKQERANGLYNADRSALIKSSNNNPVVETAIGQILEGRSHELLHVHYGRCTANI